jgi:benzoate-CoA ligase
VGVVQSVDSNSLVKIKAYVVLNKTYDDKDVIKIKNEIKKRCIEELPANHYPYWIEFVNQLPKTATGKIKRFQLRILEAFLLND